MSIGLGTHRRGTDIFYPGVRLTLFSIKSVVFAVFFRFNNAKHFKKKEYTRLGVSP